MSVPHDRFELRSNGQPLRLRSGQAWGGGPQIPQGLKPGSFFLVCLARLEVVPFPVVLECGVVAVATIKVNSRFLTGPSAWFGMTAVISRGVALFAALEALRHPKTLRSPFGFDQGRLGGGRP